MRSLSLGRIGGLIACLILFAASIGYIGFNIHSLDTNGDGIGEGLGILMGLIGMGISGLAGILLISLAKEPR